MSKRILIVDDEHFVRLLLHRTLEDLEDEGVEIHFAEDGRAGLEKVRALEPDLLLLDVMMPHMNGAEVCTAVRSDPKLAGVHVIILTAKGEALKLPPEVAPHDYMTKPFDPDHVLERACTVLGVELDFL